MLNPGTILQDRYQIIRLLGQGGFGAVYHALDRSVNRAVAVKECTADPNATPQGLAQTHSQFQSEAQVLASLSHPNLPRVTDCFSFDGNEYIVMDLIDGRSLDQIVQQNGAISEGAVRAWAKQVLDALIYLQSQTPPIIHRDIKPGNIVLKDDGKVVLVDFGLVKLLDSNDPRTISAVRGLGTPGYAPIEQSSPAMHTDKRSDIYSLGATLYELLSGRRPLDVVQRMVDPTLMPSLRTVNPKVSAGMEAVVSHAIEILPQDRFQTAKEMKAALNNVQSTTEREPKPEPKTLVRITVLFVVILACCLTVAILLNTIISPLFIPTFTPTSTSTIAPTIAPTTPPTVAPTIAPTIVPTIAPTPKPTLDPAYSNLISHYTQMCLAVLPDRHIVQQTCNMQDNQRWKVTATTGTLRIEVKSGNCLGNLGGEAFVNPCSDSPIWTLVPFGNYNDIQARARTHLVPPHPIVEKGFYFQIKRDDNQCVDVDSWNYVENGHIVLDTCRNDDYSNQMWALFNPPY